MADADTPVVRAPEPAADQPRWPLVGGIAGVFAVLGFFLPRACGLDFKAEPEVAAAAGSGSVEPAPSVEPSAAPATSSAAPGPSVVSTDPPLLANVAVGKSTLMHCQDPPAGELKPSKCGEPALDPVVVPKLEALGRCPAAASVTAKLALHVDLDFKKQAVKVVAGKGSQATRNGKRDDKAIEPLLQCLRTSLKDVVAPQEGPAPARDHARYVMAYPVTVTATGAAAPAGSGTGEKEKAAVGTATVQVDTAIVRDAPATSGQPIGRLSRGTKVSTVGTSGNWWHIKFGENEAQEGWIFRTNIGK